MTTKQTKESNTEIVVAAIAAVVILECVALFLGFNGTMLTLAVGAICGLAGLTLPQLKLTK